MSFHKQYEHYTSDTLDIISRCCSYEAGEDTPLSYCPTCNKLAIWECYECGEVEWVPQGLRYLMPELRIEDGYPPYGVEDAN